MKKTALKVHNCIGIVDEDPDRPKKEWPHLAQFEDYKRIHDLNIDILNHPRLNNRLFILKPRLEIWLLNFAEQLQINPLEEYGIPEEAFHISGRMSFYLDEFKEMKKDLLLKSESLIKFQRLLHKESEELQIS